MLLPAELVNRYQNIKVDYDIDNPNLGPSRQASATVALKAYFMYNKKPTSTEYKHFEVVTHGLDRDKSFKQYHERIKAAAYGKGAPEDYALALQWAVYSGKITSPSQATLQQFLDTYMGIDCSGFATNYLIASGRIPYSTDTLINHSNAQSYFQRGIVVRQQHQIRCGDLLVMMKGDHPKSDPGHIVVVNDYLPVYTGKCEIGIAESRGHHGVTYYQL